MSRSYRKFTGTGIGRRNSWEYKKIATKTTRCFTRDINNDITNNGWYRKLAWNGVQVWYHSWQEYFINNREGLETIYNNYQRLIDRWIKADNNRPLEFYEFEEFLCQYVWK